MKKSIMCYLCACISILMYGQSPQEYLKRMQALLPEAPEWTEWQKRTDDTQGKIIDWVRKNF